MSGMVNIMNENNNITNFEPIFAMLNDELSKIGLSLVLICAGGFVLQLHGYRGTADIDAFFNTSIEISQVIRRVGEAFDINRPDELWLNNSISNMNPIPLDQYCDVVHNYSNLVVKVVNLEYLIGMKLVSARVQDLRDLAVIINDNNEIQPLDLLNKLKEMKFDIDIAMLLDAFEEARGMDWLNTFYQENETELRKLF
ncbi:MAG: DUF6036 family nucleotidyltransferase [Oscillospiraceae bacterium]|nr:DUF6036 family nucleotidyltransferase [Oscillospiraceae bacterium]